MEQTNSGQMCFSGKAGCPDFKPNQFKADICSMCGSKIQDHSGATDHQIAHALEFAVDNVGTKILEDCPGSLYLGGYKAAINPEFLAGERIKLTVNTARGIEMLMRLKEHGRNRGKLFPDLEEIKLNLDDNLKQKLDFSEFDTVCDKMNKSLSAGDSVLVHCAQGKSRSAALVIYYIHKTQGLTIPDSLKFVQHKRRMAEPNSNFLSQLLNYERNFVKSLISK